MSEQHDATHGEEPTEQVIVAMADCLLKTHNCVTREEIIAAWRVAQPSRTPIKLGAALKAKLDETSVSETPQSAVQRYTQVGSGMVPTFQQLEGKRYPAGDWVKASDYEKLERDRDARAREACTAEGRQGCSFAPSATPLNGWMMWTTGDGNFQRVCRTEAEVMQFLQEACFGDPEPDSCVEMREVQEHFNNFTNPDNWSDERWDFRFEDGGLHALRLT